VSVLEEFERFEAFSRARVDEPDELLNIVVERRIAQQLLMKGSDWLFKDGFDELRRGSGNGSAPLLPGDVLDVIRWTALGQFSAKFFAVRLTALPAESTPSRTTA
jgi:hypothetical protein